MRFAEVAERQPKADNNRRQFPTTDTYSATVLWLRSGADPLRRLVLDCTDDCCEKSTRDPATGHLTDDATDIWCRSCIGKQRKEHPENLSANTAANCACYRISKCAEINILGGSCNDISANGAADELYDQINENSRHSVVSPEPIAGFNLRTPKLIAHKYTRIS